jgi:hypothetical protein
MFFLTLITRCKNEPFLHEFVDYYFAQGVDMIHIIDDNSTLPYPDRLKSDDRIQWHKAQRFTQQTQMDDTNRIYNQIRSQSEWFIFVDCDEFVVTRKNPENTIRQELETTFKDVDCVKIPWVMFSSNGSGEYSRVDGVREKDPECLLLENTLRWDHDKKHPHPNNWRKGRCRYSQIECKCIFRGSKFKRINIHNPERNNTRTVTVDSVRKNNASLSPYYDNFRESDILSAYMTCNHYRIMSYESCVRKLQGNKLAGYKTDLNNLLLSDHSDIEDLVLASKII